MVNLTGTGASGPQLRITPATLTFANQTQNTLSAAQTVTLTSTGDTAVAFAENAVRSSADFIVQSTTCASTLSFGASCTASVQFKPSTTAYPEAGTLLFSDNAPGNPQPVYMSGQGIQGTTTASTTTLVSSLNPSAAGQSVTFTATVSGPSGNTTVPTGTVSFLDGTTTLGTGALSANGQGTFSTSLLSAGSHSITAVYSGDTNFAGSTSSVLTQVVNAPSLLSTTTTVSASATSLTTGQSVTFTGTIAGPAGNTTVPTGTVTFLDGTTTLGIGTLNSSAQATYSTSSLGAGSHSITAQYGGDTNFAGSTSSAITITVLAATPSFSIAASPASATVTAGQSAQTTITVTPANGFSQQVSFACSGLPAGGSCSFSPATVTPSGSAATTTLTIATTATSSSFTAPATTGTRGGLLLAVAAGGVLWLFRRRGLPGGLRLGVLLLLTLVVTAGCGGSSSSKNGSQTQPQTYTVTITATAGSESQTASYSLTVQ